MKNKFYLSALLIGIISTSSEAQIAMHYAALNQSVIQRGGEKSEGFGTFRTMESISFDEEKKALAVKVTVEQPVCDGQKGVLGLINPSGADWQYNVMDKQGKLIGKGEVGYNRRIGDLEPGAYFVQFTLPDGTSAMDEFKINQAEGIQVALEAHPDNKYSIGSEVSFIGKSEGASEFVWDFGDGSPLVYGSNNVKHSYSIPGKFEVKFTANNWDCQESESYTISISGPVAFEESEY
ncbi:MAG: PKD domain-containing protein [Bacteroidia bacterium]